MTDVDVWSDPIRVDEATVVVVASRRARSGRAVPLGALTISAGETTWTPVSSPDLVGLAGIAVGFMSAALAGVAMVRRPSWPEMRIQRIE